MSGIITAIWLLSDPSPEKPIMLIVVNSEPTVQSILDPSRSASQPPTGARITITSEKKMIVKPTWVGVKCKMPCK